MRFSFAFCEGDDYAPAGVMYYALDTNEVTCNECYREFWV